MPKINDVTFELSDLTEKGQRMTNDFFYCRQKLAANEAELRLLSLAQAQLFSQIKKEFINGNPFKESIVDNI